MRIENENKGMYLDETVKRQSSTKKDKVQEKRKSFFAGNLNLAKDSIEEKRKEAQKQALKVVGDAFEGRKKVDADLEERKGKIKELREEIKADNENVEWVKSQKEQLRESYGVEPDSQEEQDLKLIEKNMDSRRDLSIELTEEESERLKEIYSNGLTEYQEEGVKLHKEQQAIQDRIERNKTQIEVETAIIRGVNKELLKDQSMIQAEEQSDNIMKAASDEIMGMLKQDAVEHMDEVAEEAKEEAKEKAEEKEKTQEQIDAIKEKAEEMEALAEGREVEKEKKKEVDVPTEEILEIDQVGGTVKKELQNIVSEMKLVAEDIKGSKVDKKI